MITISLSVLTVDVSDILFIYYTLFLARQLRSHLMPLIHEERKQLELIFTLPENIPLGFQVPRLVYRELRTPTLRVRRTRC